MKSRKRDDKDDGPCKKEVYRRQKEGVKELLKRVSLEEPREYILSYPGSKETWMVWSGQLFRRNYQKDMMIGIDKTKIFYFLE